MGGLSPTLRADPLGVAWIEAFDLWKKWADEVDVVMSAPGVEGLSAEEVDRFEAEAQKVAGIQDVSWERLGKLTRDLLESSQGDSLTKNQEWRGVVALINARKDSLDRAVAQFVWDVGDPMRRDEAGSAGIKDVTPT